MGNVTVFDVDLTPDPAAEAQALACLDEREQARAFRFIGPAPVRRFVFCRAALRSILCSHLGCSNEQLTIGSSYYEKPYAIVQGKPHPIGFNVSHSRERGLIALGESGRVGADIEDLHPQRNMGLLIDTAFTPAERSDMESADVFGKKRLFFKLWTIKEALVKAVGMGLALDMSSFEVPLAMRRGAGNAEFHFPQAPSVPWRLDSIENGGSYAAVAQELRRPHCTATL